MYYYLAVAFGGALGAVTRVWLSSAMERINGSGFPLGTFTVNILGSFLIGIFFILFAEKIHLVDPWRPIVIIGFLGAMTTFSTFSLEALLLFQQGHYNTALLYVLGSVTICLFAAFAGMQLTRVLL